MSKVTKKASIKKITVNELKTWLDGYCSAHGDGWAPDAAQWAMIKEKIFALKEGVDPQHSNPQMTAPPRPAPQPVYQPQFSAPSFGAPGASLTLPEPAPVAPGQFGPSPAVPGQTIKTPNIDTSKGFAGSAFE
jgi:hypothetical protein